MNKVYRTLAIGGVSFSLFTLLNLGSTRTIAASLQDFPVPPEDIPSWVDPKLIAFAEYDYTLTPGGLGQHTNLIKGPESLFDETQSGISSLIGDWSYTPGSGWDGSFNGGLADEQSLTIVFNVANLRVPTNFKTLEVAFDFNQNLFDYIIDCQVMTDNPNDKVGSGCGVFETNPNRLKFFARITPQPDFAKLIVKLTKRPIPPLNENFLGINQDQDSILFTKTILFDQCQPIPEPSTVLSLLALGTLGAASTLKRKLKSSKSAEKETTKVG
ncbi:MAG: hypothetical protein RLZZ143_1084 [Cyanobacteriota bacterium]|jgi:hypothetical protein